MVAQADSSQDRKRSAFHNGPIAEGAADFLSSTVIVLKFLLMAAHTGVGGRTLQA